MISPDLIRKHASRLASVLDEATVKAHQRRSKKGKAFTVKQFERKAKFASDKSVEFAKAGLSAKSDAYARAAFRLRKLVKRMSPIKKRLAVDKTIYTDWRFGRKS